jgi:hypothetical protein
MICYVVFPGPSAPKRSDDSTFVDVAPELPPVEADDEHELVVVDVRGESTLTADDVTRILAKVAGDIARWGLPKSDGILHGGDALRARMQEEATSR